MMECKGDCVFNIDGKCTKQSKKDMTELEKWKNDFKSFIGRLSMPEDDFYGIMQCIDEVPNETGWIPVSERLPEEYKEVIVTDIETSDTYLSRYIGNGYWECDNGPFMNRIIAWMPLPEPYKASPTGAERSEKE